MSLAYPLAVSALLFSIGVFGVLARRNAVLVLVSVELMLNAANINLVAFDAWWADALHGGQVLTLFVITIAAAEIGIGLAIILLVFRARGSSDLDDLGVLDERTDLPEPASDVKEPDVTDADAEDADADEVNNKVPAVAEPRGATA
ncbi:MAG TPA: NADH-quinone oxidoreductase subunit NuoK [Jiangellaceae bacterium]